MEYMKCIFFCHFKIFIKGKREILGKCGEDEAKKNLKTP